MGNVLLVREERESGQSGYSWELSSVGETTYSGEHHL